MVADLSPVITCGCGLVCNGCGLTFAFSGMTGYPSESYSNSRSSSPSVTTMGALAMALKYVSCKIRDKRRGGREGEGGGREGEGGEGWKGRGREGEGGGGGGMEGEGGRGRGEGGDTDPHTNLIIFFLNIISHSSDKRGQRS